MNNLQVVSLIIILARRKAANADMRASRAALREQGRASDRRLSTIIKGGGYESHSKCLSGKENALVSQNLTEGL